MSRDMEFVMKMSLRDFFRCAPGDHCPDRQCGGFFAEVVCTWGSEGIDIHGICDRCKQRWTVYEDFDFEKAVRMETLPHGSK